MPGNYNTFSAEIASILSAIQLSGAAAFVEVLQYPTNEFSGYPAASVTPSEVQSEYFTITQNQRSYGFMVELYQQVDQATWATAFTQMRDLLDLALDAFDVSQDLNGKCDFLLAAPASWTIQEAGSGLVLAAELHLVAVKDVAFR